MAGGNPGLQDLLTAPLLSGEFDAVAEAIESIEAYLASGEEPEFDEKAQDDENAAFEFFRRMTFERYTAALSPTEQDALKSACFFGEPVWPEDVDAGAVRGGDR